MRLTFVLVAALCAFAGTGPGLSQTTATIRIATTPIDAGAEPYYANAMGFFKKAGIDVTIMPISNGAGVAAAVAGGSADIGQSNVVSIAAAHDRGIPFVIIAPASLYTSKVPQSALVVAKNSPLRSARDLNGKTFGTSGLKTIAQIGPAAWIDRNGGNSSSVNWVEMPFSAIPDAIAGGRIDAALLSEPELGNAVTNGTVRVLSYCYDAIGSDFLIGAWFSTAQWAQAHPDLVRAYESVMRETARWARANPQESAKILEAETKIHITPATKRVLFGERLDPAAVQPLIDVAARYGVLKASFPANDILALGR
jgi:NitT/TauT family transport system substrate-binding protein